MRASLRACRPEDLDTLHRIDRMCYAPGIAYSRRTLREYLGLPDSICRVAAIGAEIVGFLIAEHAAGQGHIITIDVVESARRQGIGSALLAEGEVEMAQAGALVVELETATNNATAIAFWRQHGYRIEGIIPRYYLNRLDAYRMTKRLGREGTEGL